MSVATGIALALAVLSVWVGGFGALRLRSSLDRLHAVAFVNAAAGAFTMLAAVLTDGISTRTVKVVCLLAFVLVTGSAISHAVGRALALRDGPQA